MVQYKMKNVMFLFIYCKTRWLHLAYVNGINCEYNNSILLDFIKIKCL